VPSKANATKEKGRRDKALPRPHGGPRRSAFRLLPVAFCLAFCGCAGFWDEVTSRNFQFKSLWVKPDPMVVLRDSTDGDERAKALRALHEPKQYKGTDQEQEVVVKILTAAATSERQALCRLAAIQSLGRFQDPRAVDALTAAFETAPQTFPPDTATVIQCQALTALGETHSPRAVDLLARVVREPPSAADATEVEKQQSLDVRTAAARALGNFSQAQSAEALVFVLRSEKDVALRDRARESLVQATGKDLPADAKAWEVALNQPPEKSGPTDANPIRRVAAWFH
jgi:hypothetical protein